MNTPPKNFVQQPFSYHEEVTLRIETLTNLGVGLGRVDNWVVMVPFSLPGELITARIYRNHKTYSEGDLAAVLEPSEWRSKPFCSYFGTCGGCQYQHLDYAQQLKWKAQHVRDSFERIGGFPFTEILPTIGSPKTDHYRSKITPHFQKPRGDGFPIGFLRSGTRQALVDVAECAIAIEGLNRALCETRSRLWEKPPKRGATILIRKSNEGVVTDPNAIVSETVGPWHFWFYAGGFFQNNPFVLNHLVEYVAKGVAGEGLETLLDIYCGIGIFGIASHKGFQKVIGVEIDPEAISLATHNASINGAKNCTFVPGQAESILANFLENPLQTAVILDPPRKGCDKKLLEQLITLAPQRIVYISCSPDTQARDLKILLDSGRFRIEKIQPFDLFPQTRHIENVVTVERVG